MSNAVGRHWGVGVLMGVMLGVSACSGSSDSVAGPGTGPMSFCELAEAFQVFQTETALDIADPERAPAVLSVSIEQLGYLADLAPEGDVGADIREVQAGFIRLDAAMAAEEYNVTALLLTGYADAEANAASARLEGYLSTRCGIRSAADEGDAPMPFTPDEMAALESGGDLEATQAALTSILVAELGLDQIAADCLVEGLGVEAVLDLIEGVPQDEEGSQRFLGTLESCNIAPSDLGLTELNPSPTERD